MDNKVLVEIFHARMHTHSERFTLDAVMTVDFFIEENRDLLREISAEVVRDFNVNLSGMQPVLRESITRFLKAESIEVEG